MSEYEQSLTVNAQADAIFDFIADVKNLPKYLPTTRNAEPQGTDRVRVQGQAGDHPYDADGYLRRNQSNNRMEWGSDGENHYSGWMQVQGNGSSSQVTVHLSMTPPREMIEEMQRQGKDHDQQIQQGLQKSLESIKNLCEGKGGKVE